jgi:co-chaperonin GroES (HSP10)
MRTLKNRVIVEIIEEEYRGKMLMPNWVADPRIGIVRHVGEGRKNKKGVLIPMPVKPGDKVLVPQNGKGYITLEGKPHWIIDADELLGVMEDAA